MKDHLLVCNDVSDLKTLRDSILATVRSEGYAVVRGLFEEAAVGESLKAVYEYANSATHRPSSGVTPSEVRQNLSKWSIGSKISGDGIASFAVIVYNPLFTQDRFGLHGAFEKIIQIRDGIAGRSPLTDSELLPHRFNACRVQIYPAGGGFLAEHQDLRGEANLAGGGIYLEALLLLSQKGIDYQSGGGFVKRNGATLNPEIGTRRGDLIIYDAATVHGVSDVDPQTPFDSRNLRGRAVAMATIYDSR